VQSQKIFVRDLNPSLCYRDQSKVVKKRSLSFSLSVSLSRRTLVKFNVCFFFSSIAHSLGVALSCFGLESLSLFLRRPPAAGWQKTEEHKIISFSLHLSSNALFFIVSFYRNEEGKKRFREFW